MDYKIILKINKEPKVNYILAKDKNDYYLDERTNIENYQAKTYKTIKEIIIEYKSIAIALKDEIKRKLIENKKYYRYIESSYNNVAAYLEKTRIEDSLVIDNKKKELEFYVKIINELSKVPE